MLENNNSKKMHELRHCIDDVVKSGSLIRDAVDKRLKVSRELHTAKNRKLQQNKLGNKVPTIASAKCDISETWDISARKHQLATDDVSEDVTKGKNGQLIPAMKSRAASPITEQDTASTSLRRMTGVKSGRYLRFVGNTSRYHHDASQYWTRWPHLKVRQIALYIFSSVRAYNSRFIV